MKYIVAIYILIGSSNCCFAQQSRVDQFNRQQAKLVRNSMVVLGSWSTANLLYSGISIGGAKGSAKYFHQMNLAWSGVNIGLAALGYFGNRNRDGLGYLESIKKQSTIEKIFLLNAGLDVAYIAGGFYLKERGRTAIQNPLRAEGFGNSIVLQGAALLLFDGIMYFVHQKHGRQLYQLGKNIRVAATANGIGCVVYL